VFSIGQGTSDHHAHPAVRSSERLLVVARHLAGTTLGVEHQVAVAVPAKVPYRPARKTPRPTIHGVQSAIVVGPKVQEIHTDELGRVRVQFHWDREHGYDEQSSCWMRVSQGWAGSGFGMVSIPRIGQEVLVAFYGGDPDQPVVVGRVYGVTNAVPYPLPKEKTKSGWRTESTGDGAAKSARGFNEIMFDDAIGHEHVALRAEQSLSVLAKGAESRDVGGSRTTHIGANDTTHVANLSQLQVGANAGVSLSKKQILLTTRKAHVLLDEGKLSIEAQGTISFHAGAGIKISSNAGTLWVDGTPDIDINNDPVQGPAPAPTKAGPAAGPGGGPQLPAPYRPEGTTTTVPAPGGFPEVKVE
jgi:type VI secretion system secreted protein VgrG